MNLNNPISEIMTKNVLFVHYNNKLDEVEQLMKSKNIRHVPVIKEGKLSGMVSLTDLQRLFFTKTYTDHDDKEFLYGSLSIEDIMMNKPVTIDKEATIRDAVNILIENEFHALPILDRGVLVGIVTTTDLMRFLIQNENHLAA